jgi:hypothetical protein
MSMSIGPVGLGGGGAMFEPVVSPHDSFLRFVACDMTGLYRSVDGGANWEMIDCHEMIGDTTISVVFDPSDPNRLFAYHFFRGLRSSTNRGTTWTPIQLGGGLTAATIITALAADAAGRLFVGTRAGAFLRTGTQWTRCKDSSGVDLTGTVVKFVRTADPAAPMYLATTNMIYKANGTLTAWSPVTGNLPTPLSISDFAGGSDPAGQTTLYLAMPSTGTDPTVTGGGIWRSPDGGATWTWAMTAGSGLNLDRGAAQAECELPQYEHLAVLAGDARTAYATICAARSDGRQYRVYKTTNGGTNWTHVLNVDGSVPGSVPSTPNVTGAWQDFAPFGWGNTGRGRGLGVGPSITSPAEHAVLFTNNGVLYVSDDSAATWRQAYTRQSPPQGPPGANQSWRSIGLEVTTTWGYEVSEDDPSRQFICYSDICLARSTNGGHAWFVARPQNLNTIYQLAFSPVPPPAGQFREIWAAASNMHDLPTWTAILDTPFINDPGRWSGTVLTAPPTSGGTTWMSLASGLPLAPVTSIVADRSTPPNLWAAVWGAGVYWYNWQTSAWEQRNGSSSAQLGNGANKHVYRLHWEPDNAIPAGRLYCLITGRRSTRSGHPSDNFLDDNGGLWLSSDGGGTWVCLTANLGEAARYPRGFAVDPINQDRIYLCTGHIPRITDPAGPVLQGDLPGGLWKTSNATAGAAASWAEVTSFRQSVATKQYHPDWLHAFAPFIDPHKPTKLWVTTQDWGTWVTEDVTVASPTWVEYRNLPFMRTHRLNFARGSSPLVHVSTFGGGILDLQRQVFFIADRSAFSEFDVAAAPVVGGQRTFADSLYLVFDGFLPGELGIPAGPVAQVPASVAPTIMVRRRSNGAMPTDCTVVASTPRLLVESDPIPADVAQRFTWVYDVRFTGTADFLPTGDEYIDVTATKDWLASSAAIKLFHQPNPFMLDGPIPWLSQDLRVFRVRQSNAGDPGPFPGAPPFTGASTANALAYLQQRVADLNNAPPTSSHPFDAIPDTTLTLLPADASGRPMYNFAVARVRYVPASSSITDRLRVFFRTFRTQSTSLDYQPATVYRSGANTASPPDRIPLLGVHPAGAAEEVVSIPYYDQPRVPPSVALTDQPEPTSFQLPAGAAVEQWRFFGVLLDFNQTTARFPEQVTSTTRDGPWLAGAKSIQDLVRGYHQCLTAELSYPPDPIPTGATPASSENLTQRNLAISESANPGTAASRTVHHTFELHQSRPGWPSEEPGGQERPETPPEELWGAPDELLIRWRGLPAGSQATLVCNPGDADEILTLARGRHGDARLEREGPDTIGCQVGDITYVPLPRTTRTIPLLLTVRLPGRVRHGQRFSVVIRQISGATRAVVGAFELLIPVLGAAELLWEEEDRLAVFSSIERSLAPDSRWAPVLRRYIDQIGQRVRGFGGDPEAIPPSPYGAGDHHRGRPPQEPPTSS